MQVGSTQNVRGDRSFKVIRRPGNERPLVDRPLSEYVLQTLPITNDREVNLYRLGNFVNVQRGMRRIAMARMMHLPIPIHANLYAKVIRGDGRLLDLGLISTRVVTDAGVQFLVDALQNLTEPENLKFHGFGIGTTAEAASQTALVTELTTEYATDNVRPTGSLTEGASANIFRTVATLSPDGAGTLAITEHGIFSQAATGGGTMLDRSLFSAINLTRGSDSLQTTYDLTIPSGG
jgi:hypothetical protein